MSDIGDKVAHVTRARQTRSHECHWPGCGRQVEPARWGCRPHWYALPNQLRHAIWQTYRIGQEFDRRPSHAYIEVARQVQAWIAEHGRSTTTTTTKGNSMDNQHRQIAGYRELSQVEIDLMNEIKAKGAELEALTQKLAQYLADQDAAARESADDAGRLEVIRLNKAQPVRWLSVGRTHFQEGLMSLTRSVAQPTFF